MLNQPIPGISSAKMMHDFGVTRTHTIIMDLPLSLDPLNLAKNRPVVAYDPASHSRFGIFPRYNPSEIRWFETNACCIFHTANSWDSDPTRPEAAARGTKIVNMLACRLTSASLVFSAGDLAAPTPTHRIPSNQQEEDQCRLYYYQFRLCPYAPERLPHYTNRIPHQWALSALTFEFPSLRPSAAMSAARYIYGCSVSDSSFTAALGRAVKIDSLVKMDVETLIERGKQNPPQQIKGCVDTRSMAEVLASTDPDDPIKVFKMPPGWHAQESRFIPRANGVSEDDGWILSYVFDESQLGDDGECRPGAKSELWVIDARKMSDVVARVYLPQRVPYGLHGHWFDEEEIVNQRPFETIRSLKMKRGEEMGKTSLGWGWWMGVRRGVEKWLE